MKQQLLLLDDVDGLGRSGDVVSAKSGFIRNFLLPQKKAVIADKHTLKMQARLKEEREKRAAVDRKEAEAHAKELAALVIETEVKVDPEGKLYGSVTHVDIVRLLEEKGHIVLRRNVVLPHPIKTLGAHKVELRLKENVPAFITLEVKPEGGVLPKKEEMPPAEPEEKPAEEKAEEAGEEPSES